MNSILGQGAAWPNGKKQRDWRNYKVPSCSIFKWQEMRLWDEILSSKVSYKTRFLTELLNLALRTKSSENICAFFTSLCTRNVGINMVVNLQEAQISEGKMVQWYVKLCGIQKGSWLFAIEKVIFFIKL